jgi:hypothetical protein
MVKLSDLFKYYKHGTPHQMAAVSELEAELMKAAPQVFDRSQAWYKTWQAGGKLHNYDAAVKLIKEFEGVHLSAYPDPAAWLGCGHHRLWHDALSRWSQGATRRQDHRHRRQSAIGC